VKKIYAYTTATYRTKGWLKVGETTLESAEARVAQQDGTSNPEPLEIERVWDIPDHITDKQIHAHLRKMGRIDTRLDKSREWFTCSVDDVASIINNLTTGVLRPNAYPMREEQKECVEKAVAHYKNGGVRFLTNAKMRFGKTFVGYQIAKRLAEGSDTFRVLVLTYKPATNDGWKDDLERHVDFDGWQYFYAKSFKNGPIELPHGNTVLFSSFQDMNELDKNKWDIAKNYHYNLVIIDETHYGANTSRAKTTLDAISYDYELHMSGTPLELLASGEFAEEETYSWSYIDEQNKRKTEESNNWQSEVYRWLPPMEFHTFEVCEEAKRLQNHYTDDEGFTMNKLFASEDGETFIEEASVKLFVDQFFGRNVRHNHSAIRVMAPDHMLWVMSNVAPVNAMCNLLNKMDTGYHIINVAGDNISNLDQVKKEIAYYTKTITITCGRFNTGVTVPEWDMVAMLNGGRAAETYFQTVFRVQSPDQRRGKDRCVVIDFHPQRCLEMSWLYAEIIAKNDQPTTSVLRSFLEVAPILDHTGNQIKKVDIEQVMGVLSELGSAYDSFGSQKDYDINGFDIDDWGNVAPENGVTKKGDISNSGIQEGKTYDSVNRGPRAPVSKDEMAELRKRISTAIRKIPILLAINTDRPYDSIQDLMDRCPGDQFSMFVEIELDLFREKCYNNAINVKSINRKITDWNLICGG